MGDRVFVTASGGTREDRLHILCLNTADGSVIWQRRFWAMGMYVCESRVVVVRNIYI